MRESFGSLDAFRQGTKNKPTCKGIRENFGQPQHYGQGCAQRP